MSSLPSFRVYFDNKFDLVAQGLLNTKEIFLYEYGASLADFDEKHINTYGTFKQSDKEIAEALGWSPTTVYRHRKKLEEVGLFVRLKNKATKVNFYWTMDPNNAFKLKKSSKNNIFAELKKKYSDLKSVISFLQGDFSVLQKNRSKKQSEEKAINNIERTYNGEYTKEYSESEEIKGKELDNITEAIDSKMAQQKTEKDIIDIFFKGNQKAYLKARANG
jgi:predicted transcriptional regulator